MRAPLENRKPAAWGSRAGHQEESFRDVSKPEDTPEPSELQAKRLRNRFAFSWPLARRVAELAFPHIAHS